MNIVVRFCCFFCVCGYSVAIVNIEGNRATAAKPGYGGQVTVSGNGNRGNTERLSVNLATRLQWNQDLHSRFVVASYNYGQSKEVRNINKAFVHVRWVNGLQPGKWWELFVQGSKDEFARLKFRGLVGGGLRLEILPKTQQHGFVSGLGVFYEKEFLEESVDSMYGSSLARGNGYLVYQYRLREQSVFSVQQYYQPAINRFADFRLLSQMAFLVKASEHINLKLAFDFSHDNQPPDGVGRTDTSFSSSLIYDF